MELCKINKRKKQRNWYGNECSEMHWTEFELSYDKKEPVMEECLVDDNYCLSDILNEEVYLTDLEEIIKTDELSQENLNDSFDNDSVDNEHSGENSYFDKLEVENISETTQNFSTLEKIIYTDIDCGKNILIKRDNKSGKDFQYSHLTATNSTDINTKQIIQKKTSSQKAVLSEIPQHEIKSDESVCLLYETKGKNYVNCHIEKENKDINILSDQTKINKFPLDIKHKTKFTSVSEVIISETINNENFKCYSYKTDKNEATKLLGKPKKVENVPICSQNAPSYTITKEVDNATNNLYFNDVKDSKNIQQYEKSSTLSQHITPSDAKCRNITGINFNIDKPTKNTNVFKDKFTNREKKCDVLKTSDSAKKVLSEEELLSHLSTMLPVSTYLNDKGVICKQKIQQRNSSTSSSMYGGDHPPTIKNYNYMFLFTDDGEDTVVDATHQNSSHVCLSTKQCHCKCSSVKQGPELETPTDESIQIIQCDENPSDIVELNVDYEDFSKDNNFNDIIDGELNLTVGEEHLNDCDINPLEKVNVKLECKEINEPDVGLSNILTDLTNYITINQITNKNNFGTYCNLCKSYFANQALLRRHISNCHCNVRKYSCKYCNKKFKRKEHMQRHERIHTGLRPFKCSLCKSSFKQKSHLAGHFTSFHAVNVKGEAHLKCENEKKNYCNVDPLEKVEVKLKCKDFSEQIDAITMNTNDVVLSNILTKITNDITISQKTKENKNYIQFGSTINTKNKVYLSDQLPSKAVASNYCYHCKSLFASKDILISHVQDVHNNIGIHSYSCKYCNKKFKSKEYLKSHKQIHTGVRPFKCDICKSSFNHNILLKQHFARHHVNVNGKHNLTLEKVERNNFINPLDKVKVKLEFKNIYEQSDTITMNNKDVGLSNILTNISNDITSNRCYLCKSVFANQDILRHHISDCHCDNRKLSCKYCNKKFNNKEHLQYHEQTHEGVRLLKNYTCKSSQTFLCNESTTQVVEEDLNWEELSRNNNFLIADNEEPNLTFEEDQTNYCDTNSLEKIEVKREIEEINEMTDTMTMNENDVKLSNILFDITNKI
ncbi:unnamed protein product, partial [Meganyctiphanes norvegica]